MEEMSPFGGDFFLGKVLFPTKVVFVSLMGNKSRRPVQQCHFPDHIHGTFFFHSRSHTFHSDPRKRSPIIKGDFFWGGGKCDSRRRTFSKQVQPCKATVASSDSWSTVGVPLSIHFPKYTVYHGGNLYFGGDFLGKV